MREPTPFHRLFGLSWVDFFDGTTVAVETEIDLSVKEQFLDVVLIRKGLEPLPRRLPDGFEVLVEYNLVTFKSFQETLDRWTLLELVGHYVNYRKQSSPSLKELLPESSYRLFAVCARYPRELAQQVEMRRISEGVYEVQVLGMPIRIIVVSQLPKEEHNAMLHLFSASKDVRRYGQDHYRPHSREISSLLYKLVSLNEEEPDMSDKRLEEFVRETYEEIRRRMPVEERLKGLSAEELTKRLSAEERLKGLSAEELLRALSPEAREALTKQLKVNGTSSKPQ